MHLITSRAAESRGYRESEKESVRKTDFGHESHGFDRFDSSTLCAVPRASHWRRQHADVHEA